MASKTIYGRRPTPATLYRELACPKHMVNVARKGLIELKGRAPTENLVSAVEFLEEHNIRHRILTPEGFARMLEVSLDYLKLILQCAYHTAMRKAEILGLTWDRVDLKAGFIRFKESDTKISEARSIPLDRELRQVLQSLLLAVDSQGNRLGYVFPRNSQRIKSIRAIFSRVCCDAGLTNVVFHDQRHTVTTTPRRAGVDALTAMKITGHKTMAVFKRYNTIDEDDLTVAQRQVDTYMDTKTVRPQEKSIQVIENQSCRGGGMGRRTGLKILRRATAVSVRVRPSALENQRLMTHHASPNKAV
jgi:integrase